MADEKQTSFRFSIKVLMAIITLFALGLGGWVAYSNHKIQTLTELRPLGAIVVFRDGTPHALQRIGLKRLYPFFSVPTVELYVTPKGDSALLGNSEELKPNAVVRKSLLEAAAVARSCGAQDIQLILIDSFDSDWVNFATENSMTTVSDSKQRYLERLIANQKSGANINP